MFRPALPAALLAALVLLAGCTGTLADGPDARQTTALADPPSATTTAPDPTTEATRRRDAAETTPEIAVVNNRSVPYVVRFYVLRDPSPALTVSYANGSVLTRHVGERDPLVQSVPFVHWTGSSVEPVRNVSSIRPANSTAIAKWSAAARPESTVELPRPVAHRNVTLLVVVETRATDRTLVYTAAMERCEPPRPELGRYRLTLPRDRNRVRVGSSC
ncbi:hypothetical protein [Halorussus sp. AFM4]|uniref:hypothetical protein n=1 Tax=Halorussus sp. AFM4 TaxID=3421651 RepID=UPI003EBA0C4C